MKVNVDRPDVNFMQIQHRPKLQGQCFCTITTIKYQFSKTEGLLNAQHTAHLFVANSSILCTTIQVTNL